MKCRSKENGRMKVGVTHKETEPGSVDSDELPTLKGCSYAVEWDLLRKSNVAYNCPFSGKCCQ